MTDHIFKDGDIFYWNWKDRTKSGHCCSWKAFFMNGYITDSFWSSDNKRWTPEQAARELDLEFKGNIDDLELIQAYQLKYYHDLDVTDLRHSNSGAARVYKRIGAKRDKLKMLELLNHAKMSHARNESYSSRKKDECENLMHDILYNGRDLEDIYIPEVES